MDNHNHNLAEAPKTIYTCPMHPVVVKNEPGRCPACGMELIPQKGKPQRAGGGDMKKMNHADHEAAMTNPQIAKNGTNPPQKLFFLFSPPLSQAAM